VDGDTGLPRDILRGGDSIRRNDSVPSNGLAMAKTNRETSSRAPNIASLRTCTGVQRKYVVPRPYVSLPVFKNPGENFRNVL
jgi:hypothetical protein